MDNELQYDQSPGLDRHVYESEWASLEEQVVDAPVETLPDMADVLERLLRDRGLPVDDPVAAGGVEPELLVEFRELKRVADRVARGEDVDLGDVGQAIEDFRDLFPRALGDVSN